MERIACVLLVAAACALGCGREEPPAASEGDRTAEPDNTAVNARDTRDPKSLTPFDQSESESDLRITQQIRKLIVDNDALSTTAKNVKVITRGNTVTLRGPVQTTAEKAAIAAVAQTTTGVTQVDNQLEVVGEEKTP